MAATAVWLNLNELPRTFDSYKWVYLGFDDESPTKARFKVDEGYWSGAKGESFHGVKVLNIETGRVGISYN